MNMYYSCPIKRTFAFDKYKDMHMFFSCLLDVLGSLSYITSSSQDSCLHHFLNTSFVQHLFCV